MNVAVRAPGAFVNEAWQEGLVTWVSATRFVIGGGIGGLAAAAACHVGGMAVTLLEQAPAITEVGAGLADQKSKRQSRYCAPWGSNPS